MIPAMNPTIKPSILVNMNSSPSVRRLAPGESCCGFPIRKGKKANRLDYVTSFYKLLQRLENMMKSAYRQVV
jgi:hypothetical protein